MSAEDTDIVKLKVGDDSAVKLIVIELNKSKNRIKDEKSENSKSLSHILSLASVLSLNWGVQWCKDPWLRQCSGQQHEGSKTEMSALVGAVYLVMASSIGLISKHLEHALIYRSSDIAVLLPITFISS